MKTWGQRKHQRAQGRSTGERCAQAAMVHIPLWSLLPVSETSRHAHRQKQPRCTGCHSAAPWGQQRKFLPWNSLNHIPDPWYTAWFFIFRYSSERDFSGDYLQAILVTKYNTLSLPRLLATSRQIQPRESSPCANSALVIEGRERCRLSLLLLLHSSSPVTGHL